MRPPLERSDFPITRRWSYLNHAGIAAPPIQVRDAIVACAQRATEHGAIAFPAHVVRMEEVRLSAASLLGATAGEVAFVKNTTEGLAFVAGGLPWSPGDRVVVPDLEFPSTIYPWLALQDRGVTVTRVQPEGPGRVLPADAFQRAITDGPPPKVVVTSWVQFGRGWRSDLEALAELAHEADALLCVDVIQGLGVIPLDLRKCGVDIAMADGHKWLLGPEGSGILFVREEILPRITPLEPGWASVAHRSEWDNLELEWDATARRFEGGTVNMVGLHGLGAAFDLLLEVGVDRIWHHVDALCDQLILGLEERGGRVWSDRSNEGRSGIVTFSVPGHEPGALEMDLMSKGVLCAARGGGVRVSPHGFNDDSDINALLEALPRSLP